MSSHLHFPKLKYSPLNLCAIREEAKKELDEILKTHEGDKTIVLDPALTRPVSDDDDIFYFLRLRIITQTVEYDYCGYSSIQIERYERIQGVGMGSLESSTPQRIVFRSTQSRVNASDRSSNPQRNR